MAKFQQDLTSGHVGKQLIAFSIPFLFSNLVQSVYNVADMLIVGRFVGASGISAVNIAGQITFVILGLVFGLSVGGTILVGQYIGAKMHKDSVSTIGTLFTLLGILAVVITAVMLLSGGYLLRLIQTPAEAYAEALSYLNICMAGNIFIFGYNAISSVLRGMGDSKNPLIFVSIACVINIALDLIFVGPLKMGVAGAAWATVIAQAISMIISMIYLRRNDFVFDFSLKSFKIVRDKLALIFKFGIPTAIQNVLTGISFIFITALVNSLGVEASAAVGIASKVNSFAVLPSVAISMAVSAMSAQNIGAGEFDRARKTLSTGMLLAFCITLPVFLLLELFPAAVTSLFTSETEVITYSIGYIRAVSLDFVLLPFMFCMNGLFNGAGHTRFSLVNNCISAILLRIPLAYIFMKAFGLGLLGVGFAAPLATVGSLVLGIWYLMSGKWMSNKTGISRDSAGELSA